MTATTRRRRLPRVGRLPRPGPRAFLAVAVVAAILVGGFFWVRQSSLVAVRRVTVTGLSGPDVAQIRGALTTAALGMSTLDLDRGRLHSAVAPYPPVRALRAHAEFPHGLRIAVVEQVPVAVLDAGGQRTVVAADGTLLRGARPSSALPTISSSVVPGGATLTGPPRTAVTLLAAAPYSLLGRIASASAISSDGLEIALRNGPTVVFGSESQLAAKWSAAVAVLAAGSSAGASYVDVTDPARPAAGSGADASPASHPADSTSTTG